MCVPQENRAKNLTDYATFHITMHKKTLPPKKQIIPQYFAMRAHSPNIFPHAPNVKKENFHGGMFATPI